MGFVPEFVKRPTELRSLIGRNPRSREYHDVYCRQARLRLPERLPDEALDAIAIDRAFSRFTRHRQTEPRKAYRVGSDENSDAAPTVASGSSENSRVIGPCEQPVAPGKRARTVFDCVIGSH